MFLWLCLVVWLLFTFNHEYLDDHLIPAKIILFSGLHTPAHVITFVSSSTSMNITSMSSLTAFQFAANLVTYASATAISFPVIAP